MSVCLTPGEEIGNKTSMTRRSEKQQRLMDVTTAAASAVTLSSPSSGPRVHPLLTFCRRSEELMTLSQCCYTRKGLDVKVEIRERDEGREISGRITGEGEDEETDCRMRLESVSRQEVSRPFAVLKSWGEQVCRQALMGRTASHSSPLVKTGPAFRFLEPVKKHFFLPAKKCPPVDFCDLLFRHKALISQSLVPRRDCCNSLSLTFAHESTAVSAGGRERSSALMHPETRAVSQLVHRMFQNMTHTLFTSYTE